MSAVDTSGATTMLDQLAPNAMAAARDVIARNADALLADIQARVPAGLADSLRLETTDDGARITSDAPCARLREYGGRIAVPEIVPVAAKVLAFPWRGKIVFAAHAKAHDVTVPAEPYLAPALAGIAPQFQGDMEAALSEIGS